MDAVTRALYLDTIGHTYEEDHEGIWKCVDCPGDVKWQYTPDAAEDACIVRWLDRDDSAGCDGAGEVR